MARRYTSEENEILYQEFEKGTRLSDLMRILNRSESGIVRKLQRLSEKEPDKWCIDKVRECHLQYRKEHKDEIAGRDRQYRKENKDEIAERKMRYREEHKDELAERNRQYRREHKDEIAERERKYRREHKDEIAERKREYREENRDRLAEKKRRYYKEHKKKIMERERQYYKDHKEEIAERKRQYRKRRRMRELMAGIRDVGYEIGRISEDNNTVTIELLEEMIDMAMAKIDFRDHIREAMLSVKLEDLYGELQLSYRKNKIVIDKGREELECFLKAYTMFLERS